MGNLTPSSSTPATSAAGDLLARIAIDPANDDRYPHGTVLIPTDSAVADFLRRKRNDATFVPREWVTEFHAADSRGEPQPVA
jgi:hypothetical protein